MSHNEFRASVQLIVRLESTTTFTTNKGVGLSDEEVEKRWSASEF